MNCRPRLRLVGMAEPAEYCSNVRILRDDDSGPGAGPSSKTALSGEKPLRDGTFRALILIASS
jgi:hypothetical protein